jgi:hypothetical protein
MVYRTIPQKSIRYGDYVRGALQNYATIKQMNRQDDKADQEQQQNMRRMELLKRISGKDANMQDIIEYSSLDPQGGQFAMQSFNRGQQQEKQQGIDEKKQAQNAKIQDLMQQAASNTPEGDAALRQLTMINSQAANIVISQRKAATDKQNIAQESTDREEAMVSSQMYGKPIKNQAFIVSSYIDDRKRRGLDTKDAESLYNMLSSNRTDESDKAQDIIQREIIEGQNRGFLEKPADSEMERIIFRVAGGDKAKEKELLQKYADKRITGSNGQVIEIDNRTSNMNDLEYKEFIKGYGKLKADADEAYDTVNTVKTLSNINVPTGRWQEFTMGIGAMLKDAGIELGKEWQENVAGQQSYSALAGTLVLQRLALLKGNASDKEGDFVKTTTQSLKNDPKANDFLNKFAMAKARRVIEKYQFYADADLDKDYDNSGRKVDSGWNKYWRATPFVSEAIKTKEGLPVFYYEFEDGVKALSENPNQYQSKDIRDMWIDFEKWGSSRQKQSDYVIPFKALYNEWATSKRID